MKTKEASYYLFNNKIQDAKFQVYDIKNSLQKIYDDYNFLRDEFDIEKHILDFNLLGEIEITVIISEKIDNKIDIIYKSKNNNVIEVQPNTNILIVNSFFNNGKNVHFIVNNDIFDGMFAGRKDKMLVFMPMDSNNLQIRTIYRLL